MSLLQEFKVPTPRFCVARNGADAFREAQKLGGNVVVKAQVLLFSHRCFDSHLGVGRWPRKGKVRFWPSWRCTSCKRYRTINIGSSQLNKVSCY